MKHPPKWRLALIEKASRKAAAKPCPDCQVITIHGLDGDTCAVPARADIGALSWAGELAAAIHQQRGTYLLAGGALWHRDTDHQRHPATGPVLAEHRCADPIPAAWLAPTGTSLRFPMEATDDPPF